MAQAKLGFQYEAIKSSTNITSMAGMGVILDLVATMGLLPAIRQELTLRSEPKGWSDAQQVLALMLLNIAGGSAVSDVDVLGDDEGFMRMLEVTETAGMSGKERRAHWRRMKRLKSRGLPSQSAARRDLDEFHDEAQEDARIDGTAFIPTKTDGLAGLDRIRAATLATAQQCSPQEVATLDMDATLCATTKSSALYCYKKFLAYQPLNVYWFEHQVLVHSEFRDGNVPAGFEQLRILKEALEFLPNGVKKVQMRSDTAGYQWDLLRYCAEGKSARFGVIDFAVGADVTPQLKDAVAEVAEKDWKPLIRRYDDGSTFKTDQQWAEICFVPNKSATKKDGPAYRFLVTREVLAQQDLPGLSDKQTKLPFPTMDIDSVPYKIFALVTNRLDVDGEEIIWWSRERCGQSELAHAIMKTDLAGGTLPSDRFGANAAWWAIMTLAFNLVAILRRYILSGIWATRRLKALRFGIFRIAGWVTRHARQIRVRVSQRALDLLTAARARLLSLLEQPARAG